MGKTSRKPLLRDYVDIIGIVRLNGDDVEIYSEHGTYCGTIVCPPAGKFKQGRVVSFTAREIHQYIVDWRGNSDKIFLRLHTPESPCPLFL